MDTEEFNKARTEITDEQLINKTQETLHKLCETGGRSFIMTVPPRIDDTDMIFGELINRYKKAIQMQARVMVNFADLADEVKQDIENRILKGVQTYGERLKINNGRNALQDAYEEILDLALYIKQELKERNSKISA